MDGFLICVFLVCLHMVMPYCHINSLSYAGRAKLFEVSVREQYAECLASMLRFPVLRHLASEGRQLRRTSQIIYFRSA
jgi:hypothetical protein